MKNFRPIGIPPHAHPLITALTIIMNSQRVTLQGLADRSGIGIDTIKAWRGRATPSVANLDACLNVLGYELAVRRLAPNYRDAME